jgi:succinate dehydrogenase / fumarate reductase cytochrome b subunit
MNGSNRPLSPHLQVYKPQLTSVLSITHRATGVALAAGTLLLVWWIVAAATGEEYFNFVQGIMASWVGLIVLSGFSWAVFYHLCNGIRHLFWDAGYGFELETAYKSGWATVISSFVLTGATWAIGLFG